MQYGAELDLPWLAMEEDAFSADPFPFSLSPVVSLTTSPSSTNTTAGFVSGVS